MSDRHEQARAEAERRWPLMGLDEENRVRSAFRAGVVWADANPQPRTITLDTLREEWENAEVPTADNPIRDGDVLIYPLFEGYCVWPSVGDSPLPEARILHRAPQPEPWQDLADVLGGVMLLDGVTTGRVQGIAQNLHERGVRVKGGDDNE